MSRTRACTFSGSQNASVIRCARIAFSRPAVEGDRVECLSCVCGLMMGGYSRRYVCVPRIDGEIERALEKRGNRTGVWLSGEASAAETSLSQSRLDSLSSPLCRLFFAGMARPFRRSSRRRTRRAPAPDV